MYIGDIFLGKKQTGNNQCYYCGAACGDTYSIDEYVKDTFTNFEFVKKQDSKYICEGCRAAFSTKTEVIPLCDETRENDTPRLYSWIFDSKSKIAYTKKHIDIIRNRILSGDFDPPFIVCLANSGQKHILFRCEINLDTDNFFVQLEEEKILVEREKLAEYIEIAKPVIAAIGKVAILEETTINHYIAVEKLLGKIEPLEKWLKIKNDNLAKLAVWLSPNKEACKNECKASEL